jgi:cytochrome c551/c552
MNRVGYLVLICIGISIAVTAAPPEDGRKIFLARCAACHNVNKQVLGPALAGIEERRSVEWIASFIRSSQTMVREGDAEAVKLYAAFNKIPMPDHRDLTDEQIASIIEYVRSEAKPVVAEKAPFKKPGKLTPAYVPLSIEKDWEFLLSYLLVVVVLIGVLLFAVRVRNLGRD